jgi:hypothetical protein
MLRYPLRGDIFMFKHNEKEQSQIAQQLPDEGLDYRAILLLLAGTGGGLAVLLLALLLIASGLLLLVIFGYVLLAVSLFVVVLLLWHLTRSLQDDRRYRQQRRAALVAGHTARDGVLISESQRETIISPDNPLLVLLVLLSIHQRVIDGESEPWTARNLEGTVLLRVGHASKPIGYLSKDAAAEVGNRLADRGLIVGRGDRRAGDYVPIDTGECIRMYLGDKRL